MQRSSLALACLACAIYGRRLHTVGKPMHGTRGERNQNGQDPSRVLTSLLEACNPSAAWQHFLVSRGWSLDCNSATSQHPRQAGRHGAQAVLMRYVPPRDSATDGHPEVGERTQGRAGRRYVPPRDSATVGQTEDVAADEKPDGRAGGFRYGVSRDFTVDEPTTRRPRDFTIDESTIDESPSRPPRDFTAGEAPDEPPARAPRDFTNDRAPDEPRARAPRDFAVDEAPPKDSTSARPPTVSRDAQIDEPSRTQEDFGIDEPSSYGPTTDFTVNTPPQEVYDLQAPPDEAPIKEESPSLPPPALFFATCVKGLEHLLASELRDPRVGATDVSEGHLGVHFSGSAEVGARAVLWSRTALRVMHLLAREDGIKTKDDVYSFVRDSAYWPNLVTSPEQTISVQAVLGAVRAIENGKAKWGDWPCPNCGTFVYATKDTCYKCFTKRPVADLLTNTQTTALTVKDAVVDAMLDDVGWRPSVDADNADLPLFLHVNRDTASLYRVLSGVASMHKRGYRADTTVHVAALRETLAAGMLLQAGYDPHTDVLCDPMVGSGTIAIEAALIATNTAPGILRAAPAFTRWNDELLGNDRRSLEDVWWEAVREARELRLKAAPQPIFANDVHGGALFLAERAAQAAGVDGSIVFTEGPAAEFQPQETPSLVVTNPPWDERLEGGEEAWSELGSFLKARCVGARAFVLSGNKDLTYFIRMKADSKFAIENGGMKLALLGYEVLTKEQVVQKQEQEAQRREEAAGGKENVATQHAELELEPKESQPVVNTPAGPATITDEGGTRLADGTGQDEAGLEEMFKGLYS